MHQYIADQFKREFKYKYDTLEFISGELNCVGFMKKEEE